MKFFAPIIAYGAIGFLVTACSYLPNSRSNKTGDLIPQAKSPWTVLKRNGDWQYQDTYDKSVRLGRSTNALSIAREGVTAYFLIPSDCGVKSCADGPLNWHYGVYSKAKGLSFGVSLDEGIGDYEDYLAGIYDVYDDDVRMLPSDSLKLNDGSKIVPYEYFSPYWGHRLMVKIPKGEFSTTFEFYAKTRSGLEQQRVMIERIIESFRYVEPSEPALSKKTVMRRAIDATGSLHSGMSWQGLPAPS